MTKTYEKRFLSLERPISEIFVAELAFVFQFGLNNLVYQFVCMQGLTVFAAFFYKFIKKA